MKVVFDYQIFYLQEYGGISRYFYELAKHLNKLSGCEAKIAAPFHNNKYLQQREANDVLIQLNTFEKRLAYNRFRDKRISLSESMAVKACHNKNVILHETYYTHRFHANAAKVITVHDMIYELFSNGTGEETQLIEDKKNAIREANAIIVVSQSTKNDLLKFYPEVEKKVHVVYHGLSYPDGNSVKAYQHPKPYILFVGNRSWYKNFTMLLDVYAESDALKNKFDILCFGSSSFSSQEQQTIQSLGLSANVKCLSGDDRLLFELYKGASVLAYLSKYEGFGFPVLEAYSMACRVICSNASSLPEVAGNLATMVNVSNKQEVQDALHHVLLDSEKSESWLRETQQWLQQFTWMNCAKNTAKVYHSILNA